MTIQFHQDNILPSGAWTYVFGSNLAGKHARGTARIARVNFRADFGCGLGPTGHAYALATHGSNLKALALATVEQHILSFLRHARANPTQDFFITRVGCENGDFQDDQIGPLFASAPDNCSLPDRWKIYVAQARSKPLPPPDAVEPPESTREVSRCPFCGHWTYDDTIEAPADYCHHDILPKP